ncbi:hypothetical protein EDC04DRAFT_2597759 [Pisolithus marmoratus]|nr:hypothetical protein EDC04DRAFT_2597759 [Pisolithus marmoratus]
MHATWDLEGGSGSWKKQQWWLCSGYSGGDTMGDGHSGPGEGGEVIRELMWHGAGDGILIWDSLNIGLHGKAQGKSRETLSLNRVPSFLTPTQPALCLKNNSMSQPIVPVFGCNYTKVRVPMMWNNKMLAIQDLLNAIPSEGDDPMDSYRWLDSTQGMRIAIPELSKAIQDSMAAADLAITKLCEWVPSLEGYSDRLKQAQKQTERVAVSSRKGKQKMAQDDDDDNGANDHDDDS